MADERVTPDLELYGTHANRPTTALDGTFYDETDTGNLYQMQSGSWVLVATSSGGSTYTNANPTPVTIGGIAAGSTFSAQTMTQMWDALLYPYQSPTFSSFAMTGVTTLEVGDSISGAKTFTWTTTNSANINANSIDILDVTGSATLESSLPNTGSKSHTFSSPIQLVAAGTYQFKIQGVNSHSSSFNRTLNINWYWRIYYGEDVDAGPLTQTQVKALRASGLQSGIAGTYIFLSGGYKYLAWPTALGAASSFKDASTSLDVDMQPPYLVSVTNAYGVTTNYYVYRTTYVLGGAINIIVA
jgi:hypothetical protein